MTQQWPGPELAARASALAGALEQTAGLLERTRALARQGRSRAEELRHTNHALAERAAAMEWPRARLAEIHQELDRARSLFAELRQTLLANALKFRREGVKPRIRIEAEPPSRPRTRSGRVCIRARTSGSPRAGASSSDTGE